MRRCTLFVENSWFLPRGPITTQRSAMRLLPLHLLASTPVLQSMPIFCRYGCGKELSVLRRLTGACADCDPRAVAIGRPQRLSSGIDEMSRMGATEHNKESAKWPSLRRRLRVVELFRRHYFWHTRPDASRGATSTSSSLRSCFCIETIYSQPSHARNMVR